MIKKSGRSFIWNAIVFCKKKKKKKGSQLQLIFRSQYRDHWRYKTILCKAISDENAMKLIVGHFKLYFFFLCSLTLCKPLLIAFWSFVCRWQSKEKSLLRKLLALGSSCLILGNVIITSGFLYVAHNNYPGGGAIRTLHHLESYEKGMSSWICSFLCGYFPIISYSSVAPSGFTDHSYSFDSFLSFILYFFVSY